MVPFLHAASRSLPSRHVGGTVAAQACGGFLLLASAMAQDLRPIGPSYLASSLACFDSHRQRIVSVDRSSRTWEHDARGGQGWFARPAYAPQAWDLALVYAPSLRRTLSVRSDDPQLPVVVWGYDGAAWANVPASNAPSGRLQANFVWDSQQQRLVMFGGADAWFSQWSDETWTFDGAAWTQHQPTTRPPARTLAAMAYDGSRQRVVLFGGLESNGPLADTWEWNGSTWLQRTTATTPSARWAAAIAFDPLRSRCVLYGGLGVTSAVPTELWEYDGVDWALQAPAGALPVGRLGASMVYDDGLGEVVLVGGNEPSVSSGALARTCWRWNGSRWLLHSTLGAEPGPRTGGVLALEPGNASVVLFGGAGWNGPLWADTWRWDGQQWTELPVTGPTGRAHAGCCTHPAGVWLFGGADGVTSIQYLGDTWGWDGAVWSLLATGAGPSPRMHAAMAYDAPRNRAVLFGGYDSTMLGDTWTFDGTVWQQLTPANAPSPRFGHALAYDPTAARVLLFGGLDSNFQTLTDTWSFDGVNWTQLAPPTTPTGTGHCSMQFDMTRQKMVLVAGPYLFGQTGTASAWAFDGQDWAPIPLSTNRTYAYGAQMAEAPAGQGVLLMGNGTLHQLADQQAFAESYGTACGNGAPRLSARIWPALGSAFAFECSDNDSATLVAFVAAFTTANVPIGNCTLQVAPGLVTTLQLGDSAGFASQPMALPAWPGLLGLDLYCQAASLRGSAPGGFVLSRGLAVTLGR